MIRGKCPTCGKAYEVASINDLKGFPFCSERCKLVDLGRWIDGAYAIPDKGQPDNQGVPDEAEDEEGD
jgi:endogenous inhibitor of DNA gyrase (YacG/DUF329 family)